MAEKMVIVRLSKRQARIIFGNVDGWLDAGSCKGGLEKDELEALSSLSDQLLSQMGDRPPLSAPRLASKRSAP